jgi:hypothetical protein
MCFLFASIGILSFHLNSRVRQIGGASDLKQSVAWQTKKKMRLARTLSQSSKNRKRNEKASKNKKHIQRQDGCSMEDTSFCSPMPEGTGSRFYTGMAAAFGAVRNGWNVEE